MQPSRQFTKWCRLLAGLCLTIASMHSGWAQQPSPLPIGTVHETQTRVPGGVLDANSWSAERQPRTHSVPLQRQPQLPGELTVQAENHLVSIFARDVDLRVVLGHLAEESRVNIVVAEDVQATVTTTLTKVPLWDALDAILRINGLVWSQKDDIIFVTQPGATGQTGGAPGLQLQVFDLNFTSGLEVLEVVKGLLSPSGQAFMHAVDKTQNRQTRERVVIEDYPDRLQAVSQYLASVDNAPLQVLIEAHVMQVTLTDDQRHGINLSGLLRVAGGRVDVRAQGFANGASSPGFMLGLDSTDLDGMVEALCSNSNVRTLAAPKVLVVNGQEARIQIGSRFGYFVTTTTQTSSLQSVNFLDIGVVLVVTPTITQDGNVLLAVAPKVSGGRINPDSGLPEEDTTEATTTVLLPDGKGMIIGGLIKESDVKKKTSVPWLGDLPVLKYVFSRSSYDKSRIEVIIALTPHIVPYSSPVDCREQMSYQAAMNTSGIITGTQVQPVYAGELGQTGIMSEPTILSSVPQVNFPITGNPWQAVDNSTLSTVPTVPLDHRTFPQ